MFKAMMFLRRKADLSHEQFRDHFENVHARMAQRHIGHLMIGYHRNYPSVVLEGPRSNRRSREPRFDCVSEWFLPNREAYEAIQAMFGDTPMGREFREDEEKFLDREASVRILFEDGDVIDTGTMQGEIQG